MRSRELSALVAVVGGLALALALFVPVAAVRYRRVGRVSTGDMVALVAVPVYALALWTYTLLPLPDPDAIVCQDPILQPFGWVGRLGDSWSGGSFADLLRNPALLQFLANIALFVPMGVLLRWRRRAGLITAIGTGFATSLAIELTQLTGIWGVYPCAYRFFEVDDLIANTAGAALGWSAAAIVVRHRPEARPMPTRVTAGRRLLGLACDGVAMVLTGAVAAMAWRVWLIEVRHLAVDDIEPVLQNRIQWVTAFMLQAVSVFASGRTVGEWAVDVRAEPRGGGAWTGGRRLVRLMVGPGVFVVLAAADSFASDVALVALVLAAAAVAVVAPSRGIGGLLSGTDVVPVDRRTPD